MIIENLVWISLCVYFEARSEPNQAQLMVAHSIFNRSIKRKLTPKQVIQQPHQYSWYEGFKGRNLQVEDWESFIKAVQIALWAFVRHKLGLRMGGVDHYYDDSINTPSWAAAMKPLGKLGAFYYFRG